MQLEISPSFVPRLSDDVSIIQFNKSSYTVCVGEDTKLSINRTTKMLLDYVDGNRSLEQLTGLLNDDLGTELVVHDTVTVFRRNLLGYGIFADDNAEKVKGKDNYLKLRFTLIPASIVFILSEKLGFLFDKKVFSYITIFGTIYVAAVYWAKLSFSELYSSAGTTFFYLSLGILFLSMLLHELGHAAACIKHGARPGAIGFGFYLILPAFFADVSDSWRLSRSERLMVDTGGVYMQLICCVVLCAIFQFTGNTFYLNLSSGLVVLILFNINPFLRFDGYWILSDLTNIPNLKEKSRLALRQIYLWLTKQDPQWQNNWQGWFLTSYGIMRLLFLICLMSFMLFMRRNAILWFPIDLFEFFKTIITDFSTVSFGWLKHHLSKMFIPIIFYIMVFRLTGQIIRKKRTKES